MAMRELYSPLGYHVLTYWQAGEAAGAIIVQVYGYNSSYPSNYWWTSQLSAPTADVAYSLTVDAAGRLWIAWANADGTITRNYSDDSGNTWQSYSV